MAEYVFRPQGVCSTQVSFELDDQKRIHNLCFRDGCDGGSKAVAILVEGRSAAEVADILRDTLCGIKGTSCSDQLAQALDYVLGNEPKQIAERLRPQPVKVPEEL